MSFVVLKATSPTSKTYVLLISEENKEYHELSKGDSKCRIDVNDIT